MEKLFHLHSISPEEKNAFLKEKEKPNGVVDTWSWSYPSSAPHFQPSFSYLSDVGGGEKEIQIYYNHHN